MNFTKEDRLLLRRARLASKVYEEALEATETFEGDLGMYLAYLLGAILRNKYIELDLGRDSENEIYQFLKDIYKDEAHAVWKYIKLTIPAQETAS